MSIELNKPFLIGICGGSASGKTSVANIIFKYVGLQNCLLFSMDMYYKGPNDEERKHLSDYNFDHPDALDLDLLRQHLKMLSEGKEINMPIYEFNGSYRKKETQVVKPNKIIIFEGILAFHDKRMRDMMDMKIFVDLDGDVRLSRRVYRDIKDRGRGVENVIERYHKFVKPAFEGFIKPTRKYADIIIPRGAENTPAIDLISQHLKFGLIQRLSGKNADLVSDNLVSTLTIKISMEDMFGNTNEHYDNLQLLDEKERKILLKIFTNLVNGKKIYYNKIYLDYIIKTLLNASGKDNKDKNKYYLSYSEIRDHKEELNDKIDSLCEKDVYLFIPILLHEPEEIIKQFISSDKLKSLTIIAVTLTKECYEQLLKLNRNVKFVTAFFGNGLKSKQQEQYIRSGGFIGHHAELTRADYLQPFTPSNFENHFRSLILYN